jgi:DNA-binding CsgD family transcriptional regulator
MTEGEDSRPEIMPLARLTQRVLERSEVVRSRSAEAISRSAAARARWVGARSLTVPVAGSVAAATDHIAVLGQMADVRPLDMGQLRKRSIRARPGAACAQARRQDHRRVPVQDANGHVQGTGAPETWAVALAEQSLLAIARGQWDHAEILAGRAGTVLRQAGIEESYATPLVRAVQARTAIYRGDIQAARQALISAQRQRSLLDCAIPHLAVQARIELVRAHLLLGDLAGARTLMREINQMLQRQPGLGILAGEAAALHAQLTRQRGTSSPGASALTAAELRLLPLLTTHLTATEIAAELYLSPHTIKAEVKSIYRKLDAASRHQAITRARDLGLLEGSGPALPHRGDETRPGREVRWR